LESVHAFIVTEQPGCCFAVGAHGFAKFVTVCCSRQPVYHYKAGVLYSPHKQLITHRYTATLDLMMGSGQPGVQADQTPEQTHSL